jgi:prepilin-type processing-associated H-X9-DG protein
MRRRRKFVVCGTLAILAFLLAASIILPLLNRFRRNMNRSGDEMNLHRIGLAILIYCNEHNGEFPDTLATLVAREQLSPVNLIDPDSNDTPAHGTPAEAAAQLAGDGHRTYIYLGAGLNDKEVDAMRIIVYEPLSVHESGSDVLFGDGHSEWLTAEQLKARLAHTATTQATASDCLRDRPHGHSSSPISAASAPIDMPKPAANPGA